MSRQTSLLIGVVLCSILGSPCFAGPREDFLKLIDRPRVPLDARIDWTTTADGAVQTHFNFQSDAEQRVPGLIVWRENLTGKRPAVIVIHGTGGTYKDVIPQLRQLAEKGFIAVGIDAPHHGERTKAGVKGTTDYFESIVGAWKGSKEHPFYFDTVWDVMRLIDYLQTRDDVDGSRIGMMGISKGGTETYLTTAVDPRITVAVPCIGVQSFKWALENNQWQPRIGTVQNAFNAIAADAGVKSPDAAFVKKFYDRVMPGVYGEFDGPSMLPLIAPRPLMVINGDSDDRTPLPALKECTDAAMKAYKAAGAEDRFVIRIQEKTGHKVNPDSFVAAADFFAKWLKP